MKKSSKIIGYCNTDGSGLWSAKVARVPVLELKLGIAVDLETGFKHGELQARFSTTDWDTREHGLIYTDRKWINDFRDLLMSYGYSRQAVFDVDYSEQGMQGKSYVSMDVGENFIREVEDPLLRFAIGKTPRDDPVKIEDYYEF